MQKNRTGGPLNGKSNGRRAPAYLRFALGGAILAAVGLAGCGGDQSTLRPESGAAEEIADLWWAMLIGAAVVLAAVVVFYGIAFVRRRQRGQASERTVTGVVVVGGILVPIVTLSALLAFALGVLPATSAPARGETERTVEVVGYRWFWEFRYPGTDAVTANEMHIPAGVPVRIGVETADVIHSLWVPRLNRKIDTIPGQENAIVFEAKGPGVYRGQCAEFCGLQHANMALRVVAEPPEEFRAWLEQQARPAQPPATVDERRGQELFAELGCGGCHTIRGTDAAGTLGPDLTHVASRAILAGGVLPTNPGSFAAWIVGNQHVKPGNLMPEFDLSTAELDALVAYLGSLE